MYFLFPFPETLSDLKRIKHKHGGLPTDTDLQGAARALLRLEATYGLNLVDFSRGNILGHQTEAVLSAKDTFYLGRFAYMSNNFDEALKWLEVTALQVAAQQGAVSNDTTTAIPPPLVKESQVEQMVKQVHRKLKTTSSRSSEEQKETTSYRLGLVPTKTTDRSKMTTEDDRINYEALCRGESLLPENERKKLKCYYFSPSDDPYYFIGRLKVTTHLPVSTPSKTTSIYFSSLKCTTTTHTK